MPETCGTPPTRRPSPADDAQASSVSGAALGEVFREGRSKPGGHRDTEPPISGVAEGMQASWSHRTASNGKHATCGMRLRTCAQDRGRPSCAGAHKTPPSPLNWGRAVLARGTTPVCRGLTPCDLACTTPAALPARCSGPVTGAAGSGEPSRRRLLPPGRVRGAARGSFSPAFLSPLHSNRGSLSPPCRVLVPVVASDCVSIHTPFGDGLH